MPTIFEWIQFFEERGARKALAKQQQELGDIALQRSQKELEMFDKPIYEEPAKYQADIQAPTGGTATEGYKSPITYGSLKTLLPALKENVIPERERTGMGFLPYQEKAEKPKHYQPQLFVDKTGKPFWIEPGRQIPAGAMKYTGDDKVDSVSAYQFLKMWFDPMSQFTLKGDPRAQKIYDAIMGNMESTVKPGGTNNTDMATQLGWVGPSNYKDNVTGNTVYCATVEDFMKMVEGAQQTEK